MAARVASAESTPRESVKGFSCPFKVICTPLVFMERSVNGLISGVKIAGGQRRARTRITRIWQRRVLQLLARSRKRKHTRLLAGPHVRIARNTLRRHRRPLHRRSLTLRRSHNVGGTAVGRDPPTKPLQCSAQRATSILRQRAPEGRLPHTNAAAAVHASSEHGVIVVVGPAGAALVKLNRVEGAGVVLGTGAAHPSKQ